MSGNNPYGQDSQHHVLSVLVQNRPGVLARVSALFARRGYNIFSLAVAPTEHPDYSRITIVVDLASAPLEQMTKQLFKLVDVVRISELDPRHSVERELIMATVKATAEQRGQIVELTNIFEGKILSVGVDAVTVSLDGSPSNIDDFMAALNQYGIVESQRTGLVALPKLDRAASAGAAKSPKGKAS
ncbi:MAG: acetolactate synthase small subunit [Actinomycetota bacterium]|jgi:acetolactate synthase-1/3 small subunit